MKTEKQISESAVNAIVNSDSSKSAKIRALSAEGLKTGAIAKKLGIRYQFAYNVLHRPLKRKEA